MKQKTIKPEDLEIFEIGERLAKHSQEREISARGRITELFPYIYQASKRMSTRAISEFLADDFGLKLSAVGVSRALKEEDKHWRKLAELMEPPAIIVGRALGISWRVLLKERGVFFPATAGEPPTVNGERGLLEYREAVEFLNRRWFSLDEEIRDVCMGFMTDDENAG
jgi:hypothetical protein